MTYSTMSAIALVLSIIATVLGIIFFIPKKNREKMGGFGKKVHDFVNFKVLFVDYVLKGFYIFTTVFTFIAGFLTMFTLKTTYRSVYDSTSIMTKTEPTTSFSIENVIYAKPSIIDKIVLLVANPRGGKNLGFIANTGDLLLFRFRRSRFN